MKINSIQNNFILKELKLNTTSKISQKLVKIQRPGIK